MRASHIICTLLITSFLAPTLMIQSNVDAENFEFKENLDEINGNSPIIIRSVWDLQNISNNLSADYILDSDIDALSTYYWNSGKGFDPIGGSFTGSLNGYGYSITNLYIDRDSEDYIGLFENILSGGVVKNVNFVNADITGHNYVGVIAGSNRGTVTHCQTGGSVEGNYRVGGFMGQNAGGSVSRSKSTTTTSGNSYVGGALGFSSGRIYHLLATGSVSGYSETGGLIGYLGGAIYYCSAMGGISSNGIYIGGLVGYNHGNIRNCHAGGSTTGDSYVGGMIGYNYRYYGMGGLVDRSHSTGRVKGRSGVGGMIGVDYGGAVSRSFWDKQASGQSSSDRGIGKTTTEMKTKSTFTSAGWDFKDIWWINETNTYPQLYIDDDVAPVANAGNDTMVDEDKSVQFNGNSSTDNLRLDNYTWSFTDVDPVRFYGKNCSYIFETPGTYEVTLKVIDFAGNPDEDSMTLTVNDTTPPIAKAGENVTIDEDTRFHFNGSMSSDNYLISNYTWSFTDVDPIELKGMKPSYIFKNPGVFEVELKVYDKSGQMDTDMITINVTDTTPPEADAGDDLVVKQGTYVVFNGTNSNDNKGIEDYKWTFHYGSDITLSGPEPEYLFDEPTEITVTLNVTDGTGLWDIDTMNLIVYETTKPVADAGPDITIGMEENVTFDGSGSSDNVEVVNLTWNFYDVVPVTLYGMDPEYRFDYPGIYEVILNVSDAWMNWDVDTVIVTVEDRISPVADAGMDLEVDEGWTIGFNGSNSHDNYGIVNFTWSIEEMEPVLLYGPEIEYKFNEPGIFNVTLTVQDISGNQDSDTINVTVNDITEPITNAGSDISVDCGTEVVFEDEFSIDNVGIENYTWSFEYGSSEIDLYGPAPVFTFEIPGEYVVELTVTDGSGLKGQDILNVTVNDRIDPVASAGDDRMIGVGSKLYLNGSMSTDNYLVKDYYWSFSYDSEEKNLTGKNVSFFFDLPGEYEIELKVIDTAGNSDEDLMTLTVVLDGVLKGIVMDPEENPINGAKIEVIASDGKTYTTESSMDGSFKISIPQGPFQWKISKDNFEGSSGSSNMIAMEEISIAKEKTVLKETSEVSSGITIILIVIIVFFLIILIGIGLAIVFIRKRKLEDKVDEGEPKEEDPFARSEQLREICRQKNVPIAMFEMNYTSAMVQKNNGMEDMAKTKIENYNRSLESLIKTKGISAEPDEKIRS